jgi:hypothetical protein
MKEARRGSESIIASYLGACFQIVEPNKGECNDSDNEGRS